MCVCVCVCVCVWWVVGVLVASTSYQRQQLEAQLCRQPRNLISVASLVPTLSGGE